jgi:hypothetical protein
MVLDDLQILSNRPVWLSDWNGTAESLPRGPSRALLIALKMLKESTDEGVQSWGLNLLANFAVHSQDCCQFITDLGAGEAAARGITLALHRPKFSSDMSARMFQRQIEKMPPSLYCHSHLQRECSAAHAAMRGISLFVLQVHYGVAQPWILKFMKGKLDWMTSTGIDLTLDLLERHKNFAILQDRGLSLLSKIASKHQSLLFGGDEASGNAARISHDKMHDASSSTTDGQGSLVDNSTISQPRPNILPEGSKLIEGSMSLGSSRFSFPRSQAVSSRRLMRIVDTAMEALCLHKDDARVQRLGICLLHELVRCGGERGRSLVINAGADKFCREQLHDVCKRLSEKTSREWFRHTAGMLYLLDNSPWEDSFEDATNEGVVTDSSTTLATDPRELPSGPGRSTRSRAASIRQKETASKNPMASDCFPNYSAQREVVIYWMYRVKRSCPQSTETLFAAIRLFDIALSNSDDKPTDQSWNLYGSSCLLLSSYCFENEPSLDYRILRSSFTHFNAFISEASIWDTARTIFGIHKCAVPKPIHWDCVKHLIEKASFLDGEDLRVRLMLAVAEHLLVC